MNRIFASVLLVLASLGTQAQTSFGDRVTAAHQANAQAQQLLDDLLAAIGSIDALNAQIATLSASLAAAQTKVAADTATIVGLNAQISTLKTQVATLNTKIATLNKQIVTLKAQAATDATTIAGLKTQGATDAATIAGLKTQIAADGVTIAGLQAQIAGFVCPAPVACPAPPAPPVVTPPPPAVFGSVSLSWDAVVGATGYRVYFGPAPRTYRQPKGQGLSTTGTSYTVPGLVVLARYYFAVTAQNDVAESDYSNEVFADIGAPPPTGPDTQAPSVPTGFAAVAVSPTQINLSWNPSIDNVGTAGYYIYNGDGSTLVILKLVTSYSHTGLAPGTTRSYRISAFDAVPNHSAWTDPPISATTPLQ